MAADGDAGPEEGTLRGSEDNGHRAQDLSPCSLRLLSLPNWTQPPIH